MFVLSATVGASAQFLAQGSHLVNGSLGFEAYKEKIEMDGNSIEDAKYSAIYLMPNYSYFVIDNLGVGAALSFVSETEKDSDGDKITDSKITFGPVIRYYITDIGVFATAYVGFGNNKSKGDDFDYEESIMEWRAGIGYSIKLSESVLLDPLLTYGSATYKDKETDTKYISAGHIMFQLGLTFCFAR